MLTAQCEFIFKKTENKDSSGSISNEKRSGYYAFIDARLQNHYNAGMLYEQYQSPDKDNIVARSIKPFIGFNLLEESTVLRFAYEYFISSSSEASNSIELQFLYSMGPHKVHRF